MGLWSSAVLLAQEASPYLVKQYSGVRSIYVSTTGGNISVQGGSDAETKVELIASTWNGKGITKEALDNIIREEYELTMQQKGDHLHLEARRKGRYKEQGINISFRLTTGSLVSTDLNTSGGNIGLKDLKGDHKIATSGGNISVTNVHAQVKGSTSGGNLYLRDFSDRIRLSTSGGNISAEQGSGEITLSTTGGNVNAREVKGEVEMTTSGGNIDADMVSGSFKAVTSGGNVTIDRMYGSVEAGTSGGTMTVSVKEMGSYVRLSNAGGRISLSIPKGKGVNLDMNGSKIQTDNLEDFTGSISDGQVRGTLFGGGVPIRVSTNSRVNFTFSKD